MVALQVRYIHFGQIFDLVLFFHSLRNHFYSQAMAKVNDSIEHGRINGFQTYGIHKTLIYFSDNQIVFSE